MGLRRGEVLGFAAATAVAFAASTSFACPAHQSVPSGAEATGSPLGWFTNYGNYMPRIHCLRLADGSPDWFWIVFLIAGTATVVVGYLRIYFFWLKCYYAEQPENRNKKLGQLANIFLLCASTGYVLSIVMFFWPAYRLMAIVFVLLIGATASFLWDLKPFELTFSAVRLLRERDLAQAELAERNRSMQMVFDNVGQGFLTVDIDGRLSIARSRVVDTWLGIPASGELFSDYLARANADFASAFRMSWEALREAVLPMELALDQMPRQLRSGGRVLGFAYEPILVDGACTSLLVIIRDNTATVQQEQAEALHKDVMTVFAGWLRDRSGARQFFFEANKLVAGLTEGAVDERKVEMRALHTLKGNCATMGVRSISGMCHALETKLLESAEPLSTADRAELRDLWESFARPLDVLFGNGGTRELEITEADYEGLVDALETRRPPGELLRMVRAWRFEPTQAILSRFAASARSLAERLDKGDLEVEIVSSGFRLPRERWSPFWASFTHAVRNAVDHGIEMPEERSVLGKGKPRIELSTYARGDALVVSIRDDGPGVDWERVRACAEARGIAVGSQLELTAVLFHDGVTTKETVTDISGRGAGLAALAEVVAKLGGAIEVESVPGNGTTMRFVFPSAHFDRGQEASPTLSALRAG